MVSELPRLMSRDASKDVRKTALQNIAITKATLPHVLRRLRDTKADVRKLLNAGADKVSMNTAAVMDPQAFADAAEAFGNQCLVIAIDAKDVILTRRLNLTSHLLDDLGRTVALEVFDNAINFVDSGQMMMESGRSLSPN